MVAPFEYLALPLSVLWGILVFDEWPDAVSYLGMVLILGAGLFIVWREAATAKVQLQNPRVRR
jgi:drug/metabolite transporter (DMT)-like permease